jgi:hypothetical protein
MLLLAVFLGAIVGYILMNLPKVGVVYIGIWLGVLIAIIFENSILYKFSGAGNVLYYIFLVIFCAVFGVLSFLMFNDIIIICTSLLGVHFLLYNIVRLI